MTTLIITLIGIAIVVVVIQLITQPAREDWGKDDEQTLREHRNNSRKFN